MTGDMIDAAEALRIGLVDAVVPAGRADGRRSQELAERIAANGPLAVAEVKRLVHRRASRLTLDARARARAAQRSACCSRPPIRSEGMAAFLAKPRRAAQFKGK